MAAIIVRLEKAHDDERRTIFEAAADFPHTSRKTALVVKKAAVLGNHYHRAQTETFFLASGAAAFVAEDIGKRDETAVPGTRVAYEFEAPVVIVVEPFTAHTFQFSGPGVLIHDSDKAFDAGDSVPYKLV